MGKRKTNHRRGGVKYATSADEIEARNAREAVFNEESLRRRKERIAEANGTAAESDEELDELEEAEAQVQAAEARRKPKGMKSANPNDQPQRFTKIKDLGKAADAEAAAAEAAEPRMSRREREEAEAKRKKEAYQKLHEEGKTEEYKRDMERLQQARARRAAAAEKEQEEKARAEAAEAAIKAAAAEAGAAEAEGSEKLDAREVKKMNGKQLKEHLKERGLPIHGQKKELVTRLLEHAT